MAQNPAALIVALTACLAGSCTSGAAEGPSTRPVVVVELFTSEGCSSCPPADALLAELAKPGAVDKVDIVPLEMHVDYWNYLGWADPFSSPEFSRRQHDYAKSLASDQIYTPQMVVDGAQAFVGSDREKTLQAIGRSANELKGTVALELSPTSKDGKSAVCQIAVSGIPGNAGGRILLAVTEDDLTTDVPRGENARRRLQHASVVRSLQEVATLKPGDAAPSLSRATIDILPSWRVDHLHVAVFVQEKGTGKIVAAASARLLQPQGR